jgi:hypothetical protein
MVRPPWRKTASGFQAAQKTEQQQKQRENATVQVPSRTKLIDHRRVKAFEDVANTPILSGGGGGIFFWWEMGEFLFM